MTHIEGEEEDDMPAMNLSKLVCLGNKDEKVTSALDWKAVGSCVDSFFCLVIRSSSVARLLDDSVLRWSL